MQFGPITNMIKFSDDFKYIYQLNADGSISGTPTKLLSDEEKKEIYEQLTYQAYA